MLGVCFRRLFWIGAAALIGVAALIGLVALVQAERLAVHRERE